MHFPNISETRKAGEDIDCALNGLVRQKCSELE